MHAHILDLLIWTWLQLDNQQQQPPRLEASSTETHLSGKQGFGLKEEVYLHGLPTVELFPSQRQKGEGAQ